jgi:hypothetical protein
MIRAHRIEQLRATELEALVSEVASAVWNELIEKPSFSALQFQDYITVFDAVLHALGKISNKRLHHKKEAV